MGGYWLTLVSKIRSKTRAIGMQQHSYDKKGAEVCTEMKSGFCKTLKEVCRVLIKVRRKIEIDSVDYREGRRNEGFGTMLLIV